MKAHCSTQGLTELRLREQDITCKIKLATAVPQQLKTPQHVINPLLYTSLSCTTIAKRNNNTSERYAPSTNMTQILIPKYEKKLKSNWNLMVYKKKWQLLVRTTTHCRTVHVCRADKGCMSLGRGGWRSSQTHA